MGGVVYLDMKQIYFELEESPYNNNKYVLKPKYELLGISYIGKGSYNVLPARICNLSFPEYLRMCRDKFGAEIIGKNQLYPTAYFNKDKLSLAQELVNHLNSLLYLRA